ncbi:MAG: AAA family ATPase, partial [Chloroflexota bacterium]
MEITRVDLENVKSYERASVTFTRGTNAICGYNGAGKSTILEAIGFALFDTLLTTQEQFVRQGEKTASVTVHVAGEDGRPFQVVRKCGSYGQHYVYDPEIDQKLTDGKADTMGWLRQFAGVERRGDLSALFRDAVGVPQGLLTAAFLETPSRRKDVFNPLLRVDEYEEVWRALREPARALTDDITAQERRMAGLEGEVKGLPAQEERAADLRRSISADEDERRRAQAELDDVTGRKQQMEGVKRRLQDLRSAVAEAAGEVKAREARGHESAAAVSSAERAQAVVADTAEGHQAYLAAEEALGELERRRNERDRLEAQRQDRDKALALARREIERSEKELRTIAEAEQEMARLQPRVEVQERLEKELAAARREADRLADRRQALEERRGQLAQLEGRLTRVREGLEEQEQVEAAIRTLELELRAIDESRHALTGEAAAGEAELAQVREQTETLRSTEQAACPVCEGPLTADHRAELLERNRAREEELARRLESLRSKQAELATARQTLVARLEEHRARLKALPRPAEAAQLQEQIGEHGEIIAALEEEVERLAGAPSRVDELLAELDSLGDPRSQRARAADVAGRRDVVEEELARARGQVEALSAELGVLQEQLAAYEDLDQRIEAQRQTREAHSADHEQYVSHIREARRLDELRSRAAQQEEALAAVRAEYDRLIHERDQVAEDYDPQAHQELEAAYDRLGSTVSALEEGLRHRRQRLEETLDAIEDLRRVQAELDRTRAARDEL